MATLQNPDDGGSLWNVVANKLNPGSPYLGAPLTPSQQAQFAAGQPVTPSAMPPASTYYTFPAAPTASNSLTKWIVGGAAILLGIVVIEKVL